MEDGHDDHAARALVNLATAMVTRRRERPARSRSTSSARCGSCASASSTATSSTCSACARTCGCSAAPGRRRRPTRGASLALGEDTGVSLCPALIVLGRLQARRGDGEAGDDARGRLAARGGDGRAAAARPGRGGAGRARVARGRPRRGRRGRAAGLRAGGGARRRLGARRAGALAVAGGRAGAAASPTTPSPTRCADGGRLGGAPRTPGSGWASPTTRPRRSATPADDDARLDALAPLRGARRAALGRPPAAAPARRRASSGSRAARAPRRASAPRG